jgi:hypothetical protein
LLLSSVGLYVLVIKIDKDAEQKDVHNGSKLLVGFAMYTISYTNLYVTSLSFLGSFAISGALMLFQKVILKISVPLLKRCFGDDRRKLRSYAVPATLLALELGPCLLLLGSNMATLEFWGLLMFQEANSVAKNTGKFTDLYVAVRALLRRPVDEKELKLIEERRSTLAPCDNIGEIVSPVVIMIVIGLESVFDWLSFERAPYFLDTGITGGWRNQRFPGEAPVMLTIVFFVRVAFCWIEVKVRDRQRPNETSGATDADLGTPPNDEHANDDGENSRSNGPKARRSSMAVLYHRIACCDDSPIHMQLLAGACFALQPVLFVLYAAQFGKS